MSTRSAGATRRRSARPFATAIPKRHVEFLESFIDTCRFGDYLFVHAGIRPGVELEQQTPVRPSLDPRAVPARRHRPRLRRRPRAYHQHRGRGAGEPHRHRHWRLSDRHADRAGDRRIASAGFSTRGSAQLRWRANALIWDDLKISRPQTAMFRIGGSRVFSRGTIVSFDLAPRYSLLAGCLAAAVLLAGCADIRGGHDPLRPAVGGARPAEHRSRWNRTIKSRRWTSSPSRSSSRRT